MITFDDGFADFAANAWPLLTDARSGGHPVRHRGRPRRRAASGWPRPGSGLPMLTPREIADLAADGCEIGAHSMTHPQLDCLPHAVAYEEIRTSKDVLEQVLGRPSTPSPTRTATTAGPPRSSSSPPATARPPPSGTP